MNLFKRLQACCMALAAAWAAVPAAAQDPAPQIEVRSALVDRDSRTVGDALRARALFEQLRGLAPQAELRLRVLARQDAAQAERLKVELMAPDGRQNLPLDALSRFEIDPAWAALPPDTVLRSRQRDGGVTWRSDVRTPGLPPHVRRLGDLRLQCKLDWGVPLGRRGLLPSTTQFATLNGLCSHARLGAHNSQFADRPVLAVELVHGERRERLSYFWLHGSGDNGATRLITVGLDWPLALKDRMYRLPLDDDNWPDDTLVEFTFMDSDALALAAETAR